MYGFEIDTEKCNKCGLCAGDCPRGCIEMNDYPTMEREDCLKCQHCLAICPAGGLSIDGFNPEDSTPLNGNLPTLDMMKLLIKGRRSIRHYKNENIEPHVIKDLLDTAWHAPTSANTQSVLMTVIDDKSTLESFKKEIFEYLTDYFSTREIKNERYIMQALARFTDMYNSKGIDMLFKDAPHLVITSTPLKVPCPTADAHIMLSYFELVAQSMGIGTLWNGIAKMILTIAPHFIEKLGIPADHEIGFVMSFGKPAVKYHRTIERGSAPVNYVQQTIS